MFENICYTSILIATPLWIIAFLILVNSDPIDTEIINEYMLRAQWFGLKMYTHCENCYIKYKKSLITNDIISIICDGIEICENECEKSAIEDDNIVYSKLITSLTDTTLSILGDPEQTFDMILYKFPSKNEKYNYCIKRIEYFDILDNSLNSLDYKQGNIKLLEPCIIGSQVEIVKDNGTKETYPINLDEDNYYLENNILFDEKFINYWLFYKYRIFDFKSYKVSFFDKKTMNLEILEKNDYIIITADGCKITKSKENTNQSEYLII